MSPAGGHVHVRRSRCRHAQDRTFNSLDYQNQLWTWLVLEPIEEDGILVAVLSPKLEWGFVVAIRPNTEMTVPRRRSRVVITIHMLCEIMSMEVLKRRVTKRRQDG